VRLKRHPPQHFVRNKLFLSPIAREEEEEESFLNSGFSRNLIGE
jgi:hypothetical protein